MDVHAYGIEYSADLVELSRRTVKQADGLDKATSANAELVEGGSSAAKVIVLSEATLFTQRHHVISNAMGLEENPW